MVQGARITVLVQLGLQTCWEKQSLFQDGSWNNIWDHTCPLTGCICDPACAPDVEPRLPATPPGLHMPLPSRMEKICQGVLHFFHFPVAYLFINYQILIAVHFIAVSFPNPLVIKTRVYWFSLAGVLTSHESMPVFQPAGAGTCRHPPDWPLKRSSWPPGGID